MSDQETPPSEAPKAESVPDAHQKKDSFDMPVEKSPWLIYALLQIPIVLIMLIILYFMYQSRQN